MGQGEALEMIEEGCDIARKMSGEWGGWGSQEEGMDLRNEAGTV